MPSNEADVHIVAVCMMCCLVASALSATFAFAIARTYGVRPADKEDDPEEPQVDTVEAEVPPHPDIRHRTVTSFM